jgi:DNA-binding NarL/FixJ family response regulator
VTVRVLLADDQALMRQALRTCLEAAPDLEVVGEAGDGTQAVEMSDRLAPDVVVMDVKMPFLDGVGATALVTRRPGAPRVLVLTTFEVDDYVVDALRAGASGFLLKDATPEELVQAVRLIAEGEALLSPRVTRRLLDRYAARLPRDGEGGEAARALQGLTPRELSVLGLVAQGNSNAEISEELHLAVSSVKSHVSHLLGKLGVVDRVHLVVLAYESGLVRPRTF